jgi:hypothetical protein
MEKTLFNYKTVGVVININFCSVDKKFKEYGVNSYYLTNKDQVFDTEGSSLICMNVDTFFKVAKHLKYSPFIVDTWLNITKFDFDLVDVSYINVEIFTNGFIKKKAVSKKQLYDLMKNKVNFNFFFNGDDHSTITEALFNYVVSLPVFYRTPFLVLFFNYLSSKDFEKFVDIINYNRFVTKENAYLFDIVMNIIDDSNFIYTDDTRLMSMMFHYLSLPVDFIDNEKNIVIKNNSSFKNVDTEFF